MIAYPQLKNKFKASQDAASVVPTSGTSLRNQTLNINAEVLKYQSLTDKIMSTGSTLPDEEVDLAFESSGKVVAIYFTEGSHVKAGDLLAKINDKPLQAQLKKLEAQVPLAKDRVYRHRTSLREGGRVRYLLLFRNRQVDQDIPFENRVLHPRELRGRGTRRNPDPVPHGERRYDAEL